jgi:predicted CxxxxCH...CXXCH cytochrome family protein
MSSPVWSRGLPDPTCTGVYCHGASLSGGTLTAPVWTQVDGTQAYCGSCHSTPPEDGHTTSTACENCHSSVYDGSSFVDLSLHVNGTVNRK